MAALTLTASLLFLAGSSEAACPSKPQTPSSLTATPVPVPATRGSGGSKCSVDALKLGVCAYVLGLGGELTNLLAGSRSTASKTKKPCCELIAGLVDLDAAVCLCTAIKANRRRRPQPAPPARPPRQPLQQEAPVWLPVP
ncbi:hypothetical protein ACQ4PT_018375 [Festuca glaucescens]